MKKKKNNNKKKNKEQYETIIWKRTCKKKDGEEAGVRIITNKNTKRINKK